MKIWIIGANGLLGKTLSTFCEKKKMRFFVTGRAQADITNLEMLKRIAEKFQPTHMINCAGFTDVDGAETKAELAFGVNADGPENLAHIARDAHAKLIHVSTNFVFDGLKPSSYLETDACHPLSVYGQSKWEGEQRILSILPTACIIRTSWLFGKGGKNFISSILALLKTQQELRVVDDQIACLTHSKDLCEAILGLLCHSGIFHFANRGECSRFQAVQELLSLAKGRGSLACQTIIPVSSSAFTMAAKRPSYSPFNLSKVEGVLGREIPTWQEALKEYVCAVC